MNLQKTFTELEIWWKYSPPRLCIGYWKEKNLFNLN